MTTLPASPPCSPASPPRSRPSCLLRGAEPAAPAPRARAPRAPGTGTDAEIARLQAAVRADPRAVDAARRARRRLPAEGARDRRPGFYTRADGLLRARAGARARRRRRARRERRAGARRATTSAAGSSSRGAHAPRDRQRSRRIPRWSTRSSSSAATAPPSATLQRMVDAKPTLAGYARVSYLRELHGDLDGAAAAMRRAVAAGGPARESVAAVQALLGGLELARGRPRRGTARAARGARGGPGLPGRRGRAGAAGRRARRSRRGDPALARARRRGCRCPSTCSASARRSSPPGARRAARRDLALVGRRAAAARAGGRRRRRASSPLFEADHGAPQRAVALARRAWRAAPGLRAADALGWALTRAGRPAAGLRWARRALRARQPRPALPPPRGHRGAARAGRPERGARAAAQRARARARRLAVAGPRRRAPRWRRGR